MKFKEDDFYSKNGFQMLRGNNKILYAKDAAIIAQQEFDFWLNEQPIVYGKLDYRMNSFCGNPELLYKDGSISTHTARLVDIKAIENKKCEHDPVSVLDDIYKSKTVFPGKVGFSFYPNANWVCSKCHMKLKANWEAIR